MASGKLCNLQDCANRIKHAQHNGHNYFFSWEYELTKDLKVIEDDDEDGDDECDSNDNDDDDDAAAK